MTSPLATSVNRLNGDDYPATYCAAIMITKVKMPTQRRCDFALDTIKTLQKPEPM